MKNLKYLLIMIIAVLGLNSCSYIWNQFTDAIYDLAHEGEERKKIDKDDEFAYINPNYKKEIRNVLYEINKREITKKAVAFENAMYPETGRSFEILIPIGTELKGFHLIDEQTGYGLPIRILLMTATNDKECYAEEAIKTGDKWKISISVRYGAPMVAEDIAQKIGRKNGFKICKQ